MKFKFLRLPSKPTPAFPDKHSVLSPIIPIRLINRSDQSRFLDLRAMIDSGADISIFPYLIADQIGLQIDKTRIQPIRGIETSEIITYRHEIILEVGGWKFDTHACFCPSEITFPVLGRVGFFDLFGIKFDYRKEEIELKPQVKPLS